MKLTIGKLESNLFSVIIKISKIIITSYADSNLFLTELMLRYSSETFLDVYYVTYFKLEIYYHPRGKCLFGSCLDLELEFLLIVPLCQSLIS